MKEITEHDNWQELIILLAKKIMDSVTSYSTELFNKLKLSELNASQWKIMAFLTLLYGAVQ